MSSLHSAKSDPFMREVAKTSAQISCNTTSQSLRTPNSSPGHSRSHSAGNIPVTSPMLTPHQHHPKELFNNSSEALQASNFDHLSILSDCQSPSSPGNSWSQNATSWAYRPFMSFSTLVSGHTLGTDQDPCSVTSEPIGLLSHHLKEPNNSCENSPRVVSEIIPSQTLKSSHDSKDRNETKMVSSDEKKTFDAMRYLRHAKKSRRSRTHSKEKEHLLEHQKKYGGLTDKTQDMVLSNSLKDITNHRSLSESLLNCNSVQTNMKHTLPSVHISFSNNELSSITNTDESTDFEDSTIEQVQSGTNDNSIDAPKRVSGWSCNVNDVLRRKQELEDEIRMLEDGQKTDEFSFIQNDTTKSRRIPIHVTQSLPEDIAALSHAKSDINSREMYRRKIDRDLLRKSVTGVDMKSKPRSVLGKPPVAPKKSHVFSLREVGEGHFPNALAKHNSETSQNEHVVSRHMRKHNSAPSFEQKSLTEVDESGDKLKDSSAQEILDSVQGERRRKNGRRTLSDLGFDSPTTSPKRSASRTTALLSNPAYRKHLARTMGLSHSASEEEVKEMMDEKLESVLYGNQRMGRASSTKSLCSHGYYEMQGLHKTSSLSDGLHDIEDRSVTNDLDDTLICTNASDNVFYDREKDKVVVSNDGNVLNNCPLPPSKSSKFAIPTFSDFRRRKHSDKKRSVSKSVDRLIQDPISEEPEHIEKHSEQNLTEDLNESSVIPGANNRSEKQLTKHKSRSLRKFASVTSVNASPTTQSSRNCETSCDCSVSKEIVSEKNSYDENQNSKNCSNCGKLRRNFMSGLGALPFTAESTASLPPRSILKPKNELETVLLESTSPRESIEDKLTKHNQKWSRKIQETEGAVNRSVSDVSEKCAEEERKKSTKDRRHKANKSDPLGKSKLKKQIQESLGRGSEGAEIENELLSIISDVQLSTQIGSAQSLESTATHGSAQSVDSCLGETSSEERPIPPPRLKRARSKKKKKKRKDHTVKCDVERTDSGVGKETLTPNSTEKDLVCSDCDVALSIVDAARDGAVRPCERCACAREERKRTILEIVHTEESYGNDLNILHQEFYVPMKCNGLLTPEQLSTIFLNLEELISINKHFQSKLEAMIEIAKEQGDEDLATVNLGRLFLETTNILLAFETYCIDQSEATLLLEQLEKERELLKIFLEVSQAENSALRRMHLKAFLMVPVQRITKYPLLLTRVYKKTPDHNEDKPRIKKAKVKIEEILDHINNKTKGSIRVKKKFALQQLLKRQTDNAHEDLETHKLAIESLGWNKHEVHIAYSGKLNYALMPDLTQTKRGKIVKYVSVYAVLVIQGGKGNTYERHTTSGLLFPQKSSVNQAALVLLKEKASRFSPQREPFFLDKCVITMDDEFPETFEIHEMSSAHEVFLLKSEELKETTIWYNHIKYQTKDLGKWRHRRNALPNIMITLGK